jgi:hypothetical protein
MAPKGVRGRKEASSSSKALNFSCPLFGDARLRQLLPSSELLRYARDKSGNCLCSSRQKRFDAGAFVAAVRAVLGEKKTQARARLAGFSMCAARAK